MRTTLNIDDDLLKAAKITAIQEGVTLTAYIEQLIRRARRAERGTWKPTPHGGGPLPGLNYDRFSELVDEVEASNVRP